MTSTKTNKLVPALATITLVGLATMGIHYFTGEGNMEVWDMMIPIYAFLWFLSGSLLIMVYVIWRKDPTRAGMGYLIGSVVKMLLALVFLLPIIYGGHPYAKSISLQFLIPYAAFFISEVVIVLRWVNRPLKGL